MRKGVLIIECKDKDDPGSEGRLLREVLRLMQVSVELVHAESIQELISAVATSDYKYVHVSTHGVVRKNRGFSGWWAADGPATKDAFREYEGKFAGKSLVSTACRSGVISFGEFVVRTLGANHYIAPRGSPYWHNAALFSHIFYFKLFRTRGTVVQAFESYKESYKNPHDFRLFQRTAS